MYTEIYVKVSILKDKCANQSKNEEMTKELYCTHLSAVP